MTKKAKSNKKKEILSGHKRTGKKFIPPYLTLEELEEVRWTNRILPELIWMGILNDSYGVRHGVELSTAIVVSADAVFGRIPVPIFALNSAYSLLNAEEKEQVLEKLNKDGILKDIRNSLNEFLYLYPESPLAFIQEIKENNEVILDATAFKATLKKHYIRINRPAMLIQTNAVYFAVLCGKLKFTSNVQPPNFEIIVNNFNSKEGLQEASRIRSIVTLFFGKNLNKIDEGWVKYFWNRGLEIDHCSYYGEFKK